MHRKRAYHAFFLLICDLLAASAALPMAYQSRSNIYNLLVNFIQGKVHPALYSIQEYLWFLLVTVPLILIFYFYNSELKPVYRFRTLYGQLIPVTEEVLVSAFAIGFVSFTLKLDISRSLILLYLAYMYLIMLGCRLVFVVYFKILKGSRNGQRRVLFIGNSEGMFEVAQKITGPYESGYALIGYLTDLPALQSRAGKKCLGNIGITQQILENQVVDEVVFTGSAKADLEIFERVALLCEEQGILTRLSLEFFPHSISRTSLDFIENQPFLRFSTVPEQMLALAIKRTLDIAGALVGIILSLPFFLIMPVLIRLTSKGTAIYRQTRCGLYGRKFVLYKFRSMVEGAEDILWEIKHLNEMNGPTFKMRKDPRVTPLGRFMRKTSIDELPQFFNVLKGEMSLVGPRAPLPEEVLEYARWQRRRLSVKPGITCIWQSSGRNEINFEEWMKLDLKYIDNWSLWLDFKILLRTIPTVLLCRGAR